MRLFYRRPLMLLLCLCSFAGATPNEAIETEARTLVQNLQDRYNRQDLDGFLELCHPNMESPTRDMLKQVLAHMFGLSPAPRIQWTIEKITSQGDITAIHLATQEWHQNDQEKPIEKTALWVLQRYQQQLCVRGMHDAVPNSRMDPQTDIYTSDKGMYSLTIPNGWITMNGPMEMRAITVDSLSLLAPDLQSGIFIGVLQLPITLGNTPTEACQKAIETDMSMIRRMSTEHRILSQGPTEVDGKAGYRTLTRVHPKDAQGVVYPARQRLRVYFMDDNILYFIVCDAIGPDQYATLEPQFNHILESFKITTPPNGLRLSEALAAQGAQGSVSDRVYTSEKYNCFIAAPDGWEIKTNPDPVTLVQMQYTQGKSIARIIASKGIAGTRTPADLATKRNGELAKVVQNFKEVSHRDITLQDVPAYESIQTFSLEGLGDFHVKEVTLVRDDAFYLILCQCISPDRFVDLEADFDAIIESFGFIQ